MAAEEEVASARGIADAAEDIGCARRARILELGADAVGSQSGVDCLTEFRELGHVAPERLRPDDLLQEPDEIVGAGVDVISDALLDSRLHAYPPPALRRRLRRPICIYN